MSFLKSIYKKWVTPLWLAVTRAVSRVTGLFARIVGRVLSWHEHKLATDPRYAVALVTLGGALGRILLPIQWVIGFVGDLIREMFKLIEPRPAYVGGWDDDDEFDSRPLPRGRR